MSYRETATDQATFRFIYRTEGEKGWKRDLPQEFAAVFVELMHKPPIESPQKRLGAYLNALSTSSDLSHLVERVKANGARVYFADLAESEAFSVGHDTGLLVVQSVLGLSLWWRSLFAKEKKGKVRRLANFLAGLWLLAGVVELVGYLVIRFPGNLVKKGWATAWAEVSSRLSNLHPEKPLLFLRNLVLAEKIAEAVELEAKKGVKPRIVLDFHYGHAGLLRMVRWSAQKRRAMLEAYLPLFPKMLEDPVKADYLARLMSVVWEKEGWQPVHSFKVDPLELVVEKQLGGN